MPPRIDLDLRRVQVAPFRLRAPVSAVIQARTERTLIDAFAQLRLATPQDLRLGGPEAYLYTFQRSANLPVTRELDTEVFVALAQRVTAAGGDTRWLELTARELGVDAFGGDVEWPLVGEGEKSLAVELAQLRLNQVNAAGLEVDGDYGPNTRLAVEAFQAAKSLTVDGVLAAGTWAALMETMPVHVAGETSDAIGIAQRRLDDLGYGKLSGTRFFGPQTTTALASFQTEAGLPVRGSIDVQCWRSLLGAALAHVEPDTIAARKLELRGAADSQLTALPEAARPDVQNVLHQAIEWYGIRESPPHSNRGPEVDQLVGTRGWFWCSLAVSAWLKRGLKADSWAQIPFGAEFAAVNDIRAWGVAGRRFLPSGAPVPPGAILIKNRDGVSTPPQEPFANGHTGLVLQDLGDKVLCIEGNASDAVQTNVRAKDEAGMVGFVRWW